MTPPAPSAQPLRITIAMGAFFPMPPAPCGAVEYVWHGLAEAFARRGHVVTVLCRAHPTQGDDETVNGVRYIRRTAMSRGKRLRTDLLKDLWYSARMLRRLPRADILVTNVFFLPAMVPWFRRGAGVVVVNIQRMPKGQLWLYDHCERLAVVSRAVLEAVETERPKAAPRVRIIPNPIEVGVFTPPDGGRRPPANGAGVVLYTGRVNQEKGLHVLVEAWRGLRERHPGLRLRIIGPWTLAGGGGGEDYVRRLKAIAGPSESMLEIGEPIFDRPALAAALRAADYYCYPSLADRGETFGVAPLEAMGTGLPTVVSDLACFRDFVTPGENALSFDHRAPEPAKALGAALERLIGDPRAALAMGARGAETARRYSYDAVADQYLADFETLMAGRRR